MNRWESKLTAPQTKRLKLKSHQVLSNFAFNFNLHRYKEVIVFTAGMEGYAKPLTDTIDPTNLIDGRATLICS